MPTSILAEPQIIHNSVAFRKAQTLSLLSFFLHLSLKKMELKALYKSLLQFLDFPFL